MKCIYKYPLVLEDGALGCPEGMAKVEISVPKSFEALKVDVQRGSMVVWGMFDAKDFQSKVIRFWVALTGSPFDLPPKAKHVATLTDVAGFLVAHLFWEDL